jgi:hypothetical protein
LPQNTFELFFKSNFQIIIQEISQTFKMSDIKNQKCIENIYDEKWNILIMINTHKEKID